MTGSRNGVEGVQGAGSQISFWASSLQPRLNIHSVVEDSLAGIGQLLGGVLVPCSVSLHPTADWNRRDEERSITKPRATSRRSRFPTACSHFQLFILFGEKARDPGPKGRSVAACRFRGGKEYHLPVGWKRFAVQVKGVYDDGRGARHLQLGSCQRPTWT